MAYVTIESPPVPIGLWFFTSLGLGLGLGGQSLGLGLDNIQYLFNLATSTLTITHKIIMSALRPDPSFS